MTPETAVRSKLGNQPNGSLEFPSKPVAVGATSTAGGVGIPSRLAIATFAEWMQPTSAPIASAAFRPPYKRPNRPDVKAISDLKPVMYRHSWYSSVRSMRTNVVIQYRDETP